MAWLRHFLWFLAVIFASVFLLPSTCRAQNIGLTLIQNADFGIVTVPTPKPTGTQNIELATNGSISYGTTGYTGPSSGTQAEIRLTGPTGGTVALSCDQTATLNNPITRPGNANLTMGTIRLRVGSTGGAGSGTACTGTGNGNTILTVTISGTAANNIIYVDQVVNASTVKIEGSYTQTAFTIQARGTGGGANGTVTRDSSTTLSFIDTVSITNVIDLDYGVAGIAGTIGAGSNIDLGTDGSRTATGNFQLSGGTPNPGQFTVTGEPTETLSVYCDTTAKLTNAAGTSSIQVTGLEVHTPSLIGPYAGGNCQGLGTAAGNWNYTPTSNNKLFIGGRLNGATAVGTLSGLFTTSNPNGVYMTVVIVRP